MEEFQEPLSLATFQPDKAYPPYLTTPRSLEACRMNGVNPIELVEIPATEYQKDFPNDPDAAQRRFERIDGARRRTLDYVMEDWKKLCRSGWMPPLAERPPSAKEAIIEVRPEAHCRLLELQAEKFRKIEQDNFDALNRMLKMEVMRADEEQRNKKIVQKHEEIQGNNDELRLKRQRMREQLHREQMERQKQKEEDFWREVRTLQEIDRKRAIEKAEQDRQNKIKEKQRREQMEFERVQRTEYTKQLKQSIVTGIDTKIDSRKKTLSLREMMVAERQEEARREKERQIQERREQKQRRLEKAKQDQIRQQEESRKQMLDRIAENEEHRRRIAENRERVRAEQGTTNEDLHKQKLDSIKAASAKFVEDKAAKTQRELEKKEELARQELIKVREAQEKRRSIKAIRQEAFEMAAMRARKAQEYRMAKLSHDLQAKEERAKAIKMGFYALNHMRNSMKDIMEKTTNELKWEMHMLRHSDSFEPEKVIKKAMKVGDKLLFPRLQRTFGVAPIDNEGNGAGFGSTTLPAPAADLFPAGAFGGGTVTAAATGDGMGTGTGHLADATGGGGGRGGGRHGGGAKTGKEGAQFDPLPIRTMTHDHLKQALGQSKERIEERQFDNPYGAPSSRNASPSNKHRGGEGGRGGAPYETGNFSDDADGDDEEGNRAILKLPPDDERHLQQRQQQARAATAGSVAAGAGSRRLQASSSSGKGSSSKQPWRAHDSPADRAPDVKLPEFKFDPMGDSQKDRVGFESASSAEGEGGEGRGRGLVPSDLSPSGKGGRSGKSTGSSYKPKPKPEVRTDVNEKAKFLEPAQGKFRREFSNDHPLAKGGSGKYHKEIKQQGLSPQNYYPVQPEPIGAKKRTVLGASQKKKAPVGKPGSVEETLRTAADIEKLTYSAQSRVVDPQSQLEQLRRQQNETLKRILQEEREAEEEREAAVRSVGEQDADEKQKLEAIFAEERRRASDRIISATREHEAAMKQAVLSMMELGGNTSDNRLPVDKPFNTTQ